MSVVTLASCSSSNKRVWRYKYDAGKSAVLVGDQAVPPANIPHAALRAVAAGNRLCGKPYRYGGGHRSFEDNGYDCSGTVCYLLHHAGCIDSPTTSEGLRKYGRKGEGKWITIYARKGHAFIVVAGLRMDTGYHGRREGPRWSTDSRPAKGYVARHPEGL